jgi:hypothetical protein
MNESDKKALTAWLGEKWHYLENDAEITCACGEKWVVKSIDVEQHENRTFTDPADFFACFDRLVEKKLVYKFLKWIDEQPLYMEENSIHEDYRAAQWRFLHSVIPTGEFRLCQLVAEWLKEG